MMTIRTDSLDEVIVELIEDEVALGEGKLSDTFEFVSAAAVTVTAGDKVYKCKCTGKGTIKVELDNKPMKKSSVQFLNLGPYVDAEDRAEAVRAYKARTRQNTTTTYDYASTQADNYYHLFMGCDYYPTPGLGDYIASYTEKEEAIKAAREKYKATPLFIDWAVILYFDEDQKRLLEIELDLGAGDE